MKKAKIIGLTLSLVVAAAVAVPAVTPATDVSAVAEAATVPVTGGKWIKSAQGAYQYQLGGKLLTGWQYIQSKTGAVWYYFNTKGVMQTGWKQIGGKWYYFKTTGAMVTGWKQIGGKWYFFATNGAMANGWKKIGGKWYYFKTTGAMVTGWKQIGGKWYLFNSSGIMQTGWQKVGSKQYYFDANGVMQTGTKTIDGQTYTFDSNGVLQNKTEQSEETEESEEKEEPDKEDATERTTEATTECAHNWVWKTHTTTVHHDAEYKEVERYSEAWDEAVYAKKILCYACKQFFDTEADYRDKSHTCAGAGSSLVSVLIGYTHHDPEFLGMGHELVKEAWDEVVEIKDYQYCSKCGTKK